MGLKAALKTLMKLTPAVNFINVLCANFMYECLFGSYFNLNVTREKVPKKHLYEKLAHIMLMKLTPGVVLASLLKLKILTELSKHNC